MQNNEPRGPRFVDTSWQFPAMIVLSIALGFPALRQLAFQEGDILTAAFTYLAAFGFSWIGVSLIANLMTRFALQNYHQQLAEDAEAAARLKAEEEALVEAEAIDVDAAAAAEFDKASA